MLLLALALLTTVAALLLRRSRRAAPALLLSRCAYVALLVQALVYFPMQSGFRIGTPVCEWTFGVALATHSLRNYPHIILFALFFLLTYAQLWSVRKPLIRSAAICMTMGLFVELAQGTTGAGNCRIRDLIPDAAGALIAAAVIAGVRKARASRTRGAGVVALLLLATFGVIGCAERVPNRPMNFAVVEEPSLAGGGKYRGGRPTALEIAALRRDLHVKTMIRLSRGDATAERAAARLANIHLIEIPLNPKLVGTPDRATRAAVERAYRELADVRNAPVYLYCDHGRDRTGFVVAVYRLRMQRWPVARIHEELARHGHGAIMRRYLPHITRELAREKERIARSEHLAQSAGRSKQEAR